MEEPLGGKLVAQEQPREQPGEPREQRHESPESSPEEFRAQGPESSPDGRRVRLLREGSGAAFHIQKYWGFVYGVSRQCFIGNKTLCIRGIQ